MGALGQMKQKVLGWTDAVATPTLRSALALTTRDITVEVAGTSCLVLAPHPDDETLGCGATIARKTSAGAPVWVGFASLGTDSHQSRHLTPRQLGDIRRGEAREACRRLGVPEDHVLFLSEEDRIATAAEPITRAITAALAAAQPEEIYVVSGLDSHPDHAALNDIVLAMLEAGTIRCPVYEYPIWFWADPHAARRWLAGVARRRQVGDGAHPSRWGLFAPVAVRTEEFLPTKRQALAAHATQVTRFHDDEPWSILEDVDEGRWLARFFQARELFFKRA
jgi:LmbE family N-acetylglucosaminyl deacetylase